MLRIEDDSFRFHRSLQPRRMYSHAGRRAGYDISYKASNRIDTFWINSIVCKFFNRSVVLRFNSF